MIKLKEKYKLPFCSLKVSDFKVEVGTMDFLSQTGAVIDLKNMTISGGKSHE